MPEQPSWGGEFLDKFSPRVREKLVSLAETFRFKAGQDIIGVDKPAERLYIIKSGQVAVEILCATPWTVYDPHRERGGHDLLVGAGGAAPSNGRSAREGRHRSLRYQGPGSCGRVP